MKTETKMKTQYFIIVEKNVFEFLNQRNNERIEKENRKKKTIK